METQRIIIEKQQARDLYRKYQEHVHYAKPIDQEIMRAYKALAQGKLVIKALESIKSAGADALGFPTLAIMRADQSYCWCRVYWDGRVAMTHKRWGRCASSLRFNFPAGTLPGKEMGSEERRAIVPTIPLNLRPKHALTNYHILWEAEWGAKIPIDPFLLRRLGKGDLWLVVAMWDLTEVERAALSARV